MTPRAIVAIPVRDEAERIAACLTALTSAQTVRPDAVILVVNNTTDATVSVVRSLMPSLGVPIELIVHDFPPERACAGAARRLGMETAAHRLGADILLTSDADSIVPPDWTAANLRHIAAGADAVAGRAVLSDADTAAIPTRLIDDDALECAYAAALDAITAAIDPDPSDPLPRHTEHSGASIAVRRDAYIRAGGMPASTLGEDRDFFAALRRIDARIRHPTDIAVTVSARIIGRAEGGMADTIRRRLSLPDPYLDTALEPAHDHARRIILRRALRDAWTAPALDWPHLADLAAHLDLPPAMIADALSSPHFGAAWEALERASPTLPRHHVPAAIAPTELQSAHQLLSKYSLSRWRERARVRVGAAKPTFAHEAPGTAVAPET